MNDKFSSRIPLRLVLTVPFVIITVGVAGLIGVLGFYNGRQTAHDLAGQLHDETAARICQQLDAYLNAPLLINNLTLDALYLEQVNPSDHDALEGFLLAQLRRFPTVTALTYANEQREYVGVWRQAYGVEWGASKSSQTTDYALEGYEITPEGEHVALLDALPNYDPRPRPWYQAAAQLNDPGWTPIYIWLNEAGIGLDAVVPVRNAQGELTGVLDASLLLSEIGDFLQEARVSEHGEAYIVDQDGLLVASSTVLEPYSSSGDELYRLAALDADNVEIQAAAQSLSRQFGDLATIDASHQFRFNAGGDPQLGQITPYQNNGLQWWIVVVIPESDFMARINANTRTVLVLTGASLLAAVLITIVLARWVTHPIVDLNRASKALADGDWSKKVVVNRRDEVGELADSFNAMSAHLQALFISLQKSEHQLSAILNNALQLMGLLDPAGTVLKVNRAALEFAGIDEEDVIGKPFWEGPWWSHSDDLMQQLRDRIQQAATGETIVYESVNRDFAGRLRDVMVSLRPIRNQAGNVVFIVPEGYDITELKRAKNAMQRNTERLQILHAIDLAILQAKTPKTIADAALAHIRQLVPVQRVSVWIIEDQTDERVLLTTNADDDRWLTVGERHSFEHEWLDLFQKDRLVIHDLREFSHSISALSDIVEQGFLSLVAIPLWVQDKLIGALTLIAHEPHACSDEDVEIAREVADQLAIAIRQAQLFEAERDQRVLAEALRDSAAVISRSLDLDEVLEHILINVERVVPHDAANVMLIEQDSARVVRGRGWAERGLGDWISGVRFDLAETHRWMEWFNSLHFQPYTIADTHADPNWQGSTESLWIRSTAKAPIQIRGELIGILNLDSATLGFFTQEHLNRLQAFADQAALAVRNAQLFRDEQQRRRIAETLVHAASMLNSTLDLGQVLDLILIQMNAVIHYDSISIQQLTDNTLEIIACQGFERLDRVRDFKIPLEPQRPNWQVVTEKKPLIVADITQEYSSFQTEDMPETTLTRTWMGLPLLSRDRVIGMITLDRFEVRPFTQEDIDLATAFANQAAAAIENARLYAQVQRHAAELEQRVVERTAELETANEELRVLSRMKDEFVSNVSHELRTPITSMLLQLYAASKVATPQEQKHLDSLRRETKRLENLIESLLLLSRLDQGRATVTFTEIDLNELAGNLVRDRQPLSQENGLTLSFSPEIACPLVMGDARLVEQVLSILLTNAVNYTPSGGQVEVEIIYNEQWGGFRVSDTGPGIPAHEREQLFSRFFRGETGRQSGKSGTGLGLAIAKEIIDRHHGQIEIRDEPDKGAVFRVWLPVEGENR